jgi:hypothetical protein
MAAGGKSSGKSSVKACSELSAGEEIEAWHKGRLFHRGRVTETIPSTGLFWIVDSRTGARKLLDVEALEIVRAEAPSIQRMPDTAPRTPHTTPPMPPTAPNVVWFSSA